MRFRPFVALTLVLLAACSGAGKALSGAHPEGGAAGDGGGQDVAVLMSCPAAKPRLGDACTGKFGCGYKTGCGCGGCCSDDYACNGTVITYLGFNDACTQIIACPDAAAERIDAAEVASDAATAVCTPGADQTCNDSPVISSLRGHCTDAGTCQCGSDAAPSPTSGRCL